jgi:hypothetical protein
MNVAYSKYSDFTQADLTAAEQAVTAAYGVYQQRKAEYDYSIEVGHEGYAKRKRLDPLNESKLQYENAVQHYNNILKSIQTGQEISIADTVAGSLIPGTSTAETTQAGSVNWKLIGLAVGAVVLVIIIFKVL